MSLLLRLLNGLRPQAKAAAPARRDTVYDLFLRNRRLDLRKWHHYFDIYER